MQVKQNCLNCGFAKVKVRHVSVCCGECQACQWAVPAVSWLWPVDNITTTSTELRPVKCQRLPFRQPLVRLSYV